MKAIYSSLYQWLHCHIILGSHGYTAMFQRLKRTWPLLLLWLDLIYGFGLNIVASISLEPTPVPRNNLPVSPEIAFSWLQVIANGGMVLTLSFTFYILLQLNRAVQRHQFWPLTPVRVAALLIVLAFSLPAWWQWLWALWALVHGQNVIEWHNLHYLMVSILLLYPAGLCLHLLWIRYRQHSSMDDSDNSGQPASTQSPS
ncbi:hypothetical protein [Snodgrassella communis]|nr:hypothetical protein [Snodgrassella communis]